MYIAPVGSKISISGQRRSQDLGLGGGHPIHFPSSPEADQIQWGGGGSSRNFSSSPCANQIQWGGGGGIVAEIFPVAAGLYQSNSLSSEKFVHISEPPGEITRHLWTLTHSNNVTTINSLEKKTFAKSLGGHGPLGPPGYATVSGYRRLCPFAHLNHGR